MYNKELEMLKQCRKNFNQTFGALIKEREQLTKKFENLYKKQLALKGWNITSDDIEEERGNLFDIYYITPKVTTSSLLTREFVLDRIYWRMIDTEIDDALESEEANV